MDEGIDTVLTFWFGRPGDDDWGAMRKAWFSKDDAFDRRCRQVGLEPYRRAAAGGLDGWTGTAAGALALVVLLDQLPRNMFRGTPAMYATDARAREIARLIDERGYKSAYSEVQALFADLPFEHSEDVADQHRHTAFVEERYRGPEREQCLTAAKRHLEIVERFGRFPHRNAILGRETTAEEQEFLKEPMSSF